VSGQSDATISNVNFSDAGEYTLDMSVVDTDASASVDVNVSQQGDATYRLTNPYPSDERGDVATFTVELDNTDSATVQFGSEGVNYAVNATVTDGDDDGEVTVAVHTYETDNADPEQVLTELPNSDDSVSDQSYTEGTSELGENNVIEAGDYGITVFDETGAEQAFGTLVVNERSTDNAQTWVSPTSNLADAGEVYDSVAEGDTVAKGDTAVVQVKASGLYDYIQTGDELSKQGVNVSIEETNPGANQDPEYITDYSLVTDAENNTVFAVIPTSSGDIEAGQEYQATFTVDEDNKLIEADAAQSVNTTFSVTESTVSFDTNRDDVYAVPNDEVNVTGTSTLAPGTEFTVTARSTAANLLQSQTVTVDSDGEWNAAFDFSDVENGTEFTFTNKETDDEVSAMVDENVEAGGGEDQTTTTNMTTTTETTTTTTETTTTAMDTTTETTTEETTETTTESDGGIPGFGIGVALVAFVAAALLALRRSN